MQEGESPWAAHRLINGSNAGLIDARVMRIGRKTRLERTETHKVTCTARGGKKIDARHKRSQFACLDAVAIKAVKRIEKNNNGGRSRVLS